MLYKRVGRFSVSATKLIDLFAARNLLYQTTLSPHTQIANTQNPTNNNNLSAYCGYDPTSDSLHLGNLVSIIMMGRLAQLGFTPIFLIGGATGMIGDPSGKSKERNLLEDGLLRSNVDSITAQIQRVYGNIVNHMNNNKAKFQISEEMSRHCIFENNRRFYEGLDVITFLRDIGKAFRMGVLLNKQAVSQRIASQEGISFTEFSYTLLQAYDFYRLSQQKNCVLQIGGSDQWGNITNGCDLVKKLSKGTVKEVHGVTMPLLLTSTGQKFGKSQGNALFLNPEKTPPSNVYQYLYNTPDDTVEKYLKIFTFLPLHHIGQLMKQHLSSPEKRIAQKTLGQEVMNILSGDQYRNQNELFYRCTKQQLKKKTGEELKNIFAQVDQKQVYTVSKEKLGSLNNLVELVAELGIRKSRAEVRRDAEKGGLYCNNEKVTVELSTLPLPAFIEQQSLAGKYLVLRFGKKNYKFIVIE